MSDSIYTKLVRAVAEMPNPKLNATNPRFGSKYATLESVQGSVKPVFAVYGLMDWVDYDLTDQAWKLYLTDGTETILLGTLPTTGFTTVQSLGSEATYAGRYLRCNAYFLVGEEDDDGNAITPQEAHGSRLKPSESPAPSPRGFIEFTALKNRLVAAGMDATAAGNLLKKELGDPRSMDEEQYRSAIANGDVLVRSYEHVNQ